MRWLWPAGPPLLVLPALAVLTSSVFASSDVRVADEEVVRARQAAGTTCRLRLPGRAQQQRPAPTLLSPFLFRLLLPPGRQHDRGSRLGSIDTVIVGWMG